MTNYSKISDENLMLDVQVGKEVAFNELYRRYSKRILYFMYRMLRQDKTKAQDLLQDVFLKIVEAPEKFDVNRNFKTWLFTIAANLCKNHFRSQKRDLLELNEGLDFGEVEHEVNQRFDVDFFNKQLGLALNELPYQYREAFILKHKEGLSLKEIAIVMDCPLGTVKSRLNGATRKLAIKLAKYKQSTTN
jgi:RNA polymerase sigma-70 factor (ECF subfamily)